MARPLLLVALVLVACGPRHNTVRYFSLAPGSPDRSMGGEGRRPRLRVADLECAEDFDRDTLRFRVTGIELRAYRYNRWASRPGTMLADALRRYVGSSRRFTVVGREEEAELVLGGRVDVLEQVVEGRRWLGRLEMVLILSRAGDGHVIWRHRIDGVEEASSREVAAVVEAQSRILSAGLDDALPGLTEAALGPDALAPPPDTVQRPRTR